MKNTTKKGEELTNKELAKMLTAAKPNTLNCPDCGAELLMGPRGGLSQNMECAAPQCGSQFNYAAILKLCERISDARPAFQPAPTGPYR